MHGEKMRLCILEFTRKGFRYVLDVIEGEKTGAFRGNSMVGFCGDIHKMPRMVAECVDKVGVLGVECIRDLR